MDGIKKLSKVPAENPKAGSYEDRSSTDRRVQPHNVGLFVWKILRALKVVSIAAADSQ